MTKRILIICALALLFGSCAIPANAIFYPRPGLQFGSLADAHSDTNITIGGAAGLGAMFGREQRFDVGAEISHFRYNGKFQYRYLDEGGNLAWKKVSDTATVTPVQAVFRYAFITENKNIRPYLGLSLGFSDLKFNGGPTPPIHIYLTGSFGGGISYQLDRQTSVMLGYRYFFSEGTESSNPRAYGYYRFQYNAHVLSISLNLLLGRLLE